jgi:predicted nucleic acid-binding protein
MSIYVDTNFLVRMYLELPRCDEAIKMLNSRSGRRAWPLPVTLLMRLELVNAIQRLVFESRSGGQWRVTPESAAMALADFNQDLSDSVFLVRSPLTLEDIEPEFDALVARYTAREGFRTYDVIHVASARALSCVKFLTFDDKTRKLATFAGMKTG